MTVLTNKFGFPEPLVDAIKNDPYNDGGATISVTRLIAPPQLVVLNERYGSQIQEDVSERLWATFGQLMHLLLERAGKGNERYITEKRMLVTFSADFSETVKTFDSHAPQFFPANGAVVLSGQLDLFDRKTSTLADYKFVGEYAYKLAKAEGKKEWEEQLNVLRWLFFKTEGILAERLEIVCLARDYNARSESPGGIVEIPVWDLNATEQFIIDRLRIHMAAKQAPDHLLPQCSDEDRWFNPKTGKYGRCERYCPVRSVCKQV